MVFGASFGVLARSAGMSSLAAVVMSATAFAGSAQFAAVSVLAAGGGVVAAVAAAVLLNARYGPMGLAASPAIRGKGGQRLVEAQLVVDEAWALSSHRGRFDRHILLGAGLPLYSSWVVGTAVGVLASEALGDPEALGLDAAFPALFMALLAGQLVSAEARAAAVAGAAISLALVPLVPAGVPIVAASAGCLVGLRRKR